MKLISTEKNRVEKRPTGLSGRKRWPAFLAVAFAAVAFAAVPAAAGAAKVTALAAETAGSEKAAVTLAAETAGSEKAAVTLAAETDEGAQAGLEFSDYTELSGKRVGVITGSVFDSILSNTLPDALPEYFNAVPDMSEALLAGKIDGFLLDEPVARVTMRETEGIGYIKQRVKNESYAYVFNKDNAELEKEFSAILKELQEEGAIAEADERWFGTDESAKVLPEMKSSAEKGTLVLAVEATTVPFTYMKDGSYMGYDVDLIMQICDRAGYGLDVVPMAFASIIPGVVSGKYDVAAGCISITPERREEVLFSEPSYTGGVVMMVRMSGGAADSAAGEGGFFENLAESFEKTFVRESRWKLIVKGLGVTCLISVLSAVFGSLLGFGVCMAWRSKKRGVSLIARVFIRVMQGTPLVVILMILYYVVFTGKFSLNSVAVAVVGFSLNFAAYVSEMIRTGIDAVDPGQIEAAQAMGYNKARTFLKITFPQAARHFLPVYRGEFISMVKMTSVVGYIAIQDLTKASDIIRSRTYEAFFPLIATAVIYFLLAALLASGLQLVERRLDPMRRNREAWKPE